MQGGVSASVPVIPLPEETLDRQRHSQEEEDQPTIIGERCQEPRTVVVTLVGASQGLTGKQEDDREDDAQNAHDDEGDLLSGESNFGLLGTFLEAILSRHLE